MTSKTQQGVKKRETLLPKPASGWSGNFRLFSPRIKYCSFDGYTMHITHILESKSSTLSLKVKVDLFQFVAKLECSGSQSLATCGWEQLPVTDLHLNLHHLHPSRFQTKPSLKLHLNQHNQFFRQTYTTFTLILILQLQYWHSHCIKKQTEAKPERIAQPNLQRCLCWSRDSHKTLFLENLSSHASCMRGTDKQLPRHRAT